MEITEDKLISVLAQFNPWWQDGTVSDVVQWRRASFREIFDWTYNPPAPRAVFISGARQVGKTTLLLQTIAELLKHDVPAANILYTTFDHPIIKLAGIDMVLEAWRDREPKVNGTEYVFLDECQFINDWGTWIKHQVDFTKGRRIIFTGSAMPLNKTKPESGVGRWMTIRLTALSFYEYLRLKESYPILENFQQPRLIDALRLELSKHYGSPQVPELPKVKSLYDLFDWPQQKFSQIATLATPYVGHFHEYLLRGGFPQTAQVKNIDQAQRLLREDIIDKVLKRDMTALFGVRHILDLERTFLYLCMHDGGILDMQVLTNNLEIGRPTAQRFIELLEATHLIYRLPQFGYGKNILRAKYKIYLADAAIAPAVLLKGKNLLNDTTALGIATETAIFRHLFARYYQNNVRFTYWLGDKGHEVDLVAEIGDRIIPFEVKYRTQCTENQDLKGLLELCEKKSIKRGYVITKSLKDFGLLTAFPGNTQIMKLPAPLFCYWMGETELAQHNLSD
jgi:predicted AAA+ superfamily ATPase